jgi:O-antigen/teichoic acid export membrane protein
MSISRNARYNLMGAVVPIALALITVPIYLHLVGPDRYGVLAIAWLLLGYFGLFDLGLGRATTFHMAALRDAPGADRAQVFWSAIMVNIAMGVVGAAILWPTAHYFFAHVFKVDPGMLPELLASVPLLACAVPIATITGVLTGVMMGHERFLEVNIFSIISTALFQLLPLLVAWFAGPNLAGLLAAAVIARLLAILFLAVRAHGLVARGHPVRFDFTSARMLLGYGGWVTLTSTFGPLLVIIDRFAIGAVLGATAVTIYSVPFQLAQRIAILPNALVGAIFPRLPTASPAERDSISRKAVLSLASVLGPPVLIALFLLQPFLEFWVGRSIGVQAAEVGRFILLGFWINAFAVVAYSRLEGTGRPDLVTKILVAQIPFYLGALYFAMTHFGLVGCAVVFTVRCAVDFLLLSLAASGRVEQAGLLTTHAVLLLIGLAIAESFDHKAVAMWIWAFMLLAGSSWLSWWYMPAELRAQTNNFVQRLSEKRRPT